VDIRYYLFLLVGTISYYQGISLAMTLFNFQLKNSYARIMLLASLLAISNGYIFYVLDTMRGPFLINVLFYFLFYWLTIKVRIYYAALMTVATIIIGVLLESIIYLIFTLIPMSEESHRVIDPIGTTFLEGIVLYLLVQLILKKRWWLSFISKEKIILNPLDKKIINFSVAFVVIIVIITLIGKQMESQLLLVVTGVSLVLFGSLSQLFYKKEID